MLGDEQVAALRGAAKPTNKAANKLVKAGPSPAVERALKMLRSGRKPKDKDEVVEAALRAVEYPAWDQPLPVAGTLTPPQVELANALADRMDISTGQWVFPGTEYTWRRWLGLEGASVLERVVDGEPMWR